MTIATIFAQMACSDLAVSMAWYEKLFGKPPTRQPMPGLAEWHFTDSAEVQLFKQPENAGHSVLTLGVMPLEPERQRIVAAGLSPDPIEQVERGLFIMRMRDPDNNLVVLASAKKT